MAAMLILLHSRWIVRPTCIHNSCSVKRTNFEMTTQARRHENIMNDGRANLVESPAVVSAERNRRQTTKSFDDCCVIGCSFCQLEF